MKEQKLDFQGSSAVVSFSRALRRISSSAKSKNSKQIPRFKRSSTQQVVVRKRKLTVPIHIYDNPFFTSTDVVVAARYTKLEHIASGRFGVVVRAIDSKTGNRVAIKKVFSAFADAHSARRALREIRLLRHLNHRHIVDLVDVDYPSNFHSWDAMYLVTPLQNCELRTALLEGRVEDPYIQRRILAQLCLALEHMHSAGVMHRDVKSMNVLLDDDLNAQFCDLGSARYSSRTTDLVSLEDDMIEEAELTVGARTPLQSAPELFLNEHYDARVDMWGLGCIASEMIHHSHRHVFDDLEVRNPMKVVVQVLGYPTEGQMAHLNRPSSKWYLRRLKTNQPGTLHKILPSHDCSAVDFVAKLLRFSPSERMSATEALNHPFIAQVAVEERKRLSISMKPTTNQFNLTFTEPPEKMTKNELKELVWNEVIEIHPEAAVFR